MVKRSIRNRIQALAAFVFAAAIAGALLVACGEEQRELNILVWTGYEEPKLLKPFEEKYDIKVNYKTFVGGDKMFALLTQSKGEYDVVTVDPEYIEKLHALGRLSELDPKDYDFSDYFQPFDKFPQSRIDGRLYAVVVEWGSNALVYNTKHFSPEEVQSYDVLFKPKAKGRVSVWDWYLPFMGLVARSLGYQDPFDTTDAQFDKLKQRLFELRPQVRAIHANFPELLSSLANEDTWLVPGGAGWLAALLQEQNAPFDWNIPNEGGIMWLNSLVIPTDSPHPEMAKLYIQWMMTPEAQALLSRKQAYAANVPNSKAYPLLPEEYKKRMKVDKQADVDKIVSRLAVRSLPVQQSEAIWQDAWEQFKASRK